MKQYKKGHGLHLYGIPEQSDVEVVPLGGTIQLRNID